MFDLRKPHDREELLEYARRNNGIDNALDHMEAARLEDQRLKEMTLEEMREAIFVGANDATVAKLARDYAQHYDDENMVAGNMVILKQSKAR